MKLGRLRCCAASALMLPFSLYAMEVTLCNTDDQTPSAGKVVNLQMALQAGGAITFKCGGSTTLHMKNTYSIQRDTSIDGGGKVTLDGGHNWFGMFLGRSNTASFNVSRTKIANAGRFARPGEATIGKAHGGFIGGDFGSVQLVSVTVESSVWPVWLESGYLLVNASRFANNDGPAINGSDIQVLNQSVFSNNRGATLESDGGTVTIANSQFLSNTGPVITLGGTLKISHSTFTGNVSKGDGGALRIRSNATIEESAFTNNGAENGGAIFVGGTAATVLLRAVTFTNNVASQSGGALSFERSQLPLLLTLQHTTFEDNRAQQGGAISLQRDFRNHLSMNGGAVAFIRNQASDSGGAIYAPNAAFQLSRGVFVENRAGVAGGAIHALAQNDSQVALANSLVVRNVAPQGSAIWGNRASFINSTLADNDGTAVWPHPLPTGPTLATTPFFMQFVNSIVAGSFSAPCGAASTSIPYTGTHNLQFPGASCGPGFARAYPALGSYYVPFFWSPALGAGDAIVCATSPISHKDVYNVRRPMDRRGCSIGAAEGDIDHLIRRWRPRESVASETSGVQRP